MMSKIQKKDNWWTTFKKNWQLLLLCIPALTIYILFDYVPMFGVVMAFKKYRYNTGIFGSEWCGFDNFRYLFDSIVLWRITRNTVLYSVLFLVVTLSTQMIIALLFYEINNRSSLKIYQTCFQLPRFMSWVVISYISYAIFNPTFGMLNRVLSFLGMETVDVYRITSVWPWILTFFENWKTVGAGAIMFYASLMAIDDSLFEAAAIDGASRWKQTLRISVPGLVPIVTIMAILQIGGLFTGDFGLFYQIPQNVGMLYPATDIINTYIYRSLESGNFSAGSAVGLAQSLVGMILTLLANGVVRKIAPENAMF